jgi:hypothetical protein
VRSDAAIRHHLEMVFCAFSFCWWAYGRLPTDEPAETDSDPGAESQEGGKAAQSILAGGDQSGKGVVGASALGVFVIDGFGHS